jgi:predicted MFS family arabinose efflux permease
MGYFVAFVIGVPAAAMATKRLGWHWVFGCLSALAGLMFALAVSGLPVDRARGPLKREKPFLAHFKKRDRVAGMAAAFLTSGGVVGFLTYITAWLQKSYRMDLDKIALLFMVSGTAAAAASLVSGWLADHTGKRNVIIWANLILAVSFVVVSRSSLGVGLIVGIAAVSIAASARQAPLHALTTEIVGPEIRGEYIAVRNAASQVGIAVVAALSATAFDTRGFTAVAVIAAVSTLLIPVSCVWLKEP